MRFTLHIHVWPILDEKMWSQRQGFVSDFFFFISLMHLQCKIQVIKFEI